MKEEDIHIASTANADIPPEIAEKMRAVMSNIGNLKGIKYLNIIQRVHNTYSVADTVMSGVSWILQNITMLPSVDAQKLDRRLGIISETLRTSILVEIADGCVVLMQERGVSFEQTDAEKLKEEILKDLKAISLVTGRSNTEFWCL